MTRSGIDYYARLIKNVIAVASRQSDARALVQLAEALVGLPAESKQRLAYHSAMEHAAALNLGTAVHDMEQDHVEDWLLNESDSGGPELFLEKLADDIDNLLDDAELNPSRESCARLIERASDAVNVRANEIAREIANRKAEQGAREAAQEAYKLAYEWAYEDLFAEAYQQALDQFIESANAPVPA